MKLLPHYTPKDELRLQVGPGFTDAAVEMMTLAPLVGRHSLSSQQYVKAALTMVQHTAYYDYVDYQDMSFLPKLEALLELVMQGPRKAEHDHYNLCWLGNWMNQQGARSLILNATQIEGLAYYAKHDPQFARRRLVDVIYSDDDTLEGIKRKAHAALEAFSNQADEDERRRDEVHLAREIRRMDETNAHELERQRAIKAYEDLKARAYATGRFGHEGTAIPEATCNSESELQRSVTKSEASPEVLQGALAGGARPAESNTINVPGAGGSAGDVSGNLVGTVRSIKIGDGPEYVVGSPGPARYSLFDEVMRANAVVYKSRAMGMSETQAAEVRSHRSLEKTINFMENYGSPSKLIKETLHAICRDTINPQLEELAKKMALQCFGTTTGRESSDPFVSFARENKLGLTPEQMQQLRVPDRITVTGRRIREEPVIYRGLTASPADWNAVTNAQDQRVTPVFTPRPPRLPMAMIMHNDAELRGLKEYQNSYPGDQPDLSHWIESPILPEEAARFWDGNDSCSMVLAYYYKATTPDGIRMETLRYTPSKGLEVESHTECRQHRAILTMRDLDSRVNHAGDILGRLRRDYGVTQDVPPHFYAAIAMSVWRKDGKPLYHYQVQEADGQLQGSGGGTLEDLETHQTQFLNLLFERAI